MKRAYAQPGCDDKHKLKLINVYERERKGKEGGRGARNGGGT